MTRASEIVHGFAKLPSSRSDYFQVKSVVEDPNSSMTGLAKIISADPPLTARLLKLINSPLYGFSGKVATVSRALTILGVLHVHDLVLSTLIPQLARSNRATNQAQ